MRIALVCDDLVEFGDSERVLHGFHNLFPKAPIYTNRYDQNKIKWSKNATVFSNNRQLKIAQFSQWSKTLADRAYFKHLDLSNYELIISVTSDGAKFIKKRDARHICYCQYPSDYCWRACDDYINNSGFRRLNDIATLFYKAKFFFLRKNDFNASKSPDLILTGSSYAARQIKKAYKRESTIVCPPMLVENFSTADQPDQAPKRRGYVSATEQVSWKRMDLAIKSCIKINEPLTIIGSGPEFKRLKKFANNNPLITFLPNPDESKIRKCFLESKCYISPGPDPFDKYAALALSEGCPVIAYTQSGIADYIINKENGIIFQCQNVGSLTRAISSSKNIKFDEAKIKEDATIFSEPMFKQAIKKIILQLFPKP